jgi:hypothetical protein
MLGSQLNVLSHTHTHTHTQRDSLIKLKNGSIKVSQYANYIEANIIQASIFIIKGEKKTDIKSTDMHTGCARCAQAHPNVLEFGILCLFLSLYF